MIAGGNGQRTIEALLGAAQESPESEWVEAAAVALTLSNDEAKAFGVLASWQCRLSCVDLVRASTFLPFYGSGPTAKRSDTGERCG